MSLAKVLQQVISSNAPRIAQDVNMTSYRVLTDEELIREEGLIDHYDKLKNRNAALTSLAKSIDKIIKRIQKKDGRKQIYIQADLLSNPNKLKIDNLMKIMKVISNRYNDSKNLFKQRMAEFENLLGGPPASRTVTPETPINNLFKLEENMNILLLKDVDSQLSKDNGSGSLEGYIDFLQRRQFAIKQRLEVQAGAANDDEAKLNEKLAFDYWGVLQGNVTANVLASLNNFIDATQLRENALKDYELSYEQAKNMNYANLLTNMPQTAKGLTDQQITDFINDVSNMAVQNSQQAANLASLISQYGQTFGTYAKDKDLKPNDTVNEIMEKMTKRSKLIDFIKNSKNMVITDYNNETLVRLEATAEEIKKAHNEWDKLHFQDPGYYVGLGITIPLSELEQKNKERRELNKKLTVDGKQIWSDQKLLKEAAKQNVNNAPWKIAIEQRIKILREASDNYVNADYSEVNELSNANIETAITERKISIDKLKLYASGAALTTIGNTTKDKLPAAVEERKNLMQKASTHFSNNQIVNLKSENNAVVKSKLDENEKKYNDMATDINQLMERTTNYNWGLQQPLSYAELEQQLKEAIQQRDTLSLEYEGVTSKKLMNAGNVTVPTLKRMVKQAKDEKRDKDISNGIVANLVRTGLTIDELERTINSKTNTKESLEDDMKQIQGIVSGLQAYEPSKLTVTGANKRDVQQAYDAVNTKIENLKTKIAAKRVDIEQQQVANKKLNAIEELNKMLNTNPGVALSSDIIGENLSGQDMVAMLTVMKSNLTEDADFEKWVDSIDGVKLMKNISNIDIINAAAISFIKGFQDPVSKNNYIMCGKDESPFKSCDIGFFQGGAFFSDYARIIPSNNADSLSALDRSLQDSMGKLLDMGSKFRLSIYINLKTREVMSEFKWVTGLLDEWNFIVQQSPVYDDELRTAAVDAQNAKLAFVFKDLDNQSLNIYVDKVEDRGDATPGVDETITYLIAPSIAKDSNGKNIMVSWFEELIGNAGYTENVKKTVMHVIDTLYSPVFDPNNKNITQAARDKAQNAKLALETENDQAKAIGHITNIVNSFKSSIRLVRFKRYGVDNKPFGNNLVSIFKNDRIQPFTKIADVSQELRTRGIMVWADSQDLNQYNNKSINTVSPTPPTLLDTDDEDVVQFRFTPNI